MSETKKPRPAKAAAGEAIRAEIENLKSRKVVLETRREELATTIAGARAKRVAALASDGAADVNSIGRAIRDAEDEAEAVADALSDIESAIEAAQARLDEVNEAAMRDSSARKIEAFAGVMKRHGNELQAAVDTLAKAAKAMLDACPDDLALPHLSYQGRVDSASLRRVESGPMMPAELVSAVIADALDATLPGLFQPVHPVSSWGGYSRALFRMGDPDGLQFGASNYIGQGTSAQDSLETILLDRLAAQAAAIRVGEVSPDLGTGAKADILNAKEEDESEDVAVFCVRSFSYRSDRGARTVAPFRWTANIPADFAAEAVARGLALALDTPHGKAALAAEEVRRAQNQWSSAPLRDPEGTFDLIAVVEEREAA